MQMINIITMTSVMMMIIIIQKGEFLMKEYAKVRHFANTVMFPVNKAQKGGTPPPDTRDNGDYDDDDYNILISVQGKGAKPEC